MKRIVLLDIYSARHNNFHAQHNSHTKVHDTTTIHVSKLTLTHTIVHRQQLTYMCHAHSGAFMCFIFNIRCNSSPRHGRIGRKKNEPLVHLQ